MTDQPGLVHDGTAALQPSPTGEFTGLRGSAVEGWAWNPERPLDPVVVEFFASGIPLGQAVAAGYDEALAERGVGNGSHAFRFALPDLSQLEAPIQIRGRIAGTDHELANPIEIGAKAEAPQSADGCVGHLAGIIHGKLVGWAYDSATPEQPVSIEVWDGTERLLVAMADRPNPGGVSPLPPGADCWFVTAAPAERLLDGGVHRLRVTFSKTGRDLPGSPLVFGQLELNRLLVGPLAEELETRLQRKIADRLAKLFIDRIDALMAIQRDNIERELAALHSLLGERSAGRADAALLPTEGVVELDEGILAVGWHAVERTAGDHPYRWMTAEGVVYLDIKPVSDSVIELRGAGFAHEDCVRNLAVSVNGTRLQTDAQIMADRSWSCQVLIGRQALQDRDYLEVTLDAGQAYRPCDLDPSSADQRELSIAVSQITIRPVDSAGGDASSQPPSQS